MKENRDMMYSNYQAGGFTEPQFIPPQGYNINTQYQAFGPNVIPMNNMNMNGMNNMNMMNNGDGTNTYIDEYDQRITKLERQIRRIDQRLRKLENAGITNIEEEINVDSNMFMI